MAMSLVSLPSVHFISCSWALKLARLVELPRFLILMVSSRYIVHDESIKLYAAYAEKSEAEKDPLKNIFNCAQRAHQNTLEVFPVYSTLLLIGGLKYPEISAAAGLVHCLGRQVYASGYSTGNPDKRTRGAFGYLGLITLLGTSSLTIYHLLMD
ncbi:hypothetical protein RMCBS344292_14645 [Rhizopus microsporus]|nr:hypothetical protein RMCBS344292_14645 [Rhizopus microsporus]